LTLASPAPVTLSTNPGVETEKVTAAETPPPGVEFDTVTESVPAAARSAAGIGVVSMVALTNVVGTGLPPKLITELASKPDPLTDNVNVELPTSALAGEILFTTGSGLLTAKVDAIEVPASGAGLVTVTEYEPAVAILPADTVAVSDVELMKVVGWAAPLKLIAAPETKFDPVTDNVNAPLPTKAVAGEIAPRTGGLKTVTGSEVDDCK